MASHSLLQQKDRMACVDNLLSYHESGNQACVCGFHPPNVVQAIMAEGKRRTVCRDIPRIKQTLPNTVARIPGISKAVLDFLRVLATGEFDGSGLPIEVAFARYIVLSPLFTAEVKQYADFEGTCRYLVSKPGITVRIQCLGEVAVQCVSQLARLIKPTDFITLRISSKSHTLKFWMEARQ
ncbi:hypothetical protein [Sulfobacillus sp. hq2]|uniref:hypothetical protein n=1 Tax=Sulfobacillus TaxID=28033 RepID=UPI000CD268B6|nr:hypothetical protein [Sulfobacillus sp. hq2]POB11052.1 hypothetical protein CO251_05740 [Sulfobacillus sp. hq2]